MAHYWFCVGYFWVTCIKLIVVCTHESFHGKGRTHYHPSPLYIRACVTNSYPDPIFNYFIPTFAVKPPEMHLDESRLIATPRGDGGNYTASRRLC